MDAVRVLIIDDEKVIREGVERSLAGKNYQIANVMQTGKNIGMQMINTHLLELVENGLVETEEAIAKAVDKESLKTLLKNKGLLTGSM